jgi:hypothetical protein
MNWRRGLLLAGIHLAVAGTLMVWLESEYWPHIRSEAVRQRPVETEQMGPDGEMTISFNPCEELVSAKFPLFHAAISAAQLLDCEALLGSV